MKSIAALMAVGIAALVGVATSAWAESGVAGNVRIALDARFSPHSLPRDRPAPIRVSLDGAVRGLAGKRPPPLRRISIALNRYGRLYTRGLPVCPASALETTTSKLALKRCGTALVGRGSFGAVVDFPTEADLRVRGRVLAFNGRVGRRRAILVHVHGDVPILATVVLKFGISHPRRGRYGTVLTTSIPRIAGDVGYVTDLSLSLGRRYTFRGKRRSLISARCAAPDGFPGAVFPFARGRFLFADGRRITTTLVRDCTVR